MKQVFFVVLITFCIVTGCEKDNTPQDCNMAIITDKGNSCGFWGITRDGYTYETEKLPDDFKVDGLKVCAEFEVTTNPIACACCFDKARIISISRY